MSDEEKSLSLYDQLEEDDWALIIGSDNKLKGMFIPEGCDEDEVPESIVHIMEKYFGINFDDDEDDLEEPRTLH